MIRPLIIGNKMNSKPIIPWRLKFFARIILSVSFWRKYLEETAPHGFLGSIWLFIRCYFLYSNPNKVSRKALKLHINQLGTIPIYTFSDFFHFLEIFVLRNYDIELTETPKTVLDIGANVGMYTLRCSKQFRGAQITAFEPVQSNYKRLEENLSEIKHNAHIQNLAVGKDDGEATIYLHPVNSGAHSLYSEQVEEAEEKEIIKIRGINKVVSEHKDAIDLMKLDCEGAEYDIVMAMSPNSAKRVSTIIIETTFGLYDETEFLDRLTELGYNYNRQNDLLVAQRA